MTCHVIEVPVCEEWTRELVLSKKVREIHFSNHFSKEINLENMEKNCEVIHETQK